MFDSFQIGFELTKALFNEGSGAGALQVSTKSRAPSGAVLMLTPGTLLGALRKKAIPGFLGSNFRKMNKENFNFI